MLVLPPRRRLPLAAGRRLRRRRRLHGRARRRRHGGGRAGRADGQAGRRVHRRALHLQAAVDPLVRGHRPAGPLHARLDRPAAAYPDAPLPHLGLLALGAVARGHSLL